MNIKKLANNALLLLQANPQLIKIVCCLVVIAFTAVTQLHAQTPSDPGGEPDAVPIDGGLSLLVAAGVGYGAKKMKDKKASKQVSK